MLQQVKNIMVNETNSDCLFASDHRTAATMAATAATTTTSLEVSRVFSGKGGEVMVYAVGREFGLEKTQNSCITCCWVNVMDQD